MSQAPCTPSIFENDVCGSGSQRSSVNDEMDSLDGKAMNDYKESDSDTAIDVLSDSSAQKANAKHLKRTAKEAAPESPPRQTSTLFMIGRTGHLLVYRWNAALVGRPR